MEDTLAKLVSMPTISDDTAANERALDYIEQRLAACGMHTKRYVFKGHGALVATMQPDSKKAKVMLYAHVDVVDGSEQVFTLRKDDNKLYGRGVLDMKFAIAAYLHAIEAIQAHLADYDFAVMITTDEEYGGRDGINAIGDLLKEGYRSEVCVMPDGGRAWDVEAIAKGYWRFDLGATGVSAHASRPWEGDSASFKLIQALHELHARFVDHGPDTDTLNIGQLRGDGTYNQIPSLTSAEVEIRLATDDSSAKNQAFMDQLCKKYGLLIKTRILAEPIRQDIDHPLVQAFMESITRITGHKSKGCLSYAASDAEYFNEYGIPCVITYPPGSGHHGEQEWISRESLPQMKEIIEDYLDRNAKVRP